MEATEFSKELDKALGFCRAAAELKLPIGAMLEHVEDAIEAGITCPPQLPVAELEALREIIAAVGDVAAIGSKLPAVEPDPAEILCPLPANLRRPR